MFQHIVYSLANRQGLFTYVRTCKTRFDTTTKFLVPDNMFYHVWTWLLIYHDGSNNVVQVCSFIKPWTVCSNMHEHASLSTTLFKLASSTMFNLASSTMFNLASSTIFKPVNKLEHDENKLCVLTCVVDRFSLHGKKRSLLMKVKVSSGGLTAL